MAPIAEFIQRADLKSVSHEGPPRVVVTRGDRSQGSYLPI